MLQRVMGKSIGVLNFAIFLLFLLASPAFSANEACLTDSDPTIAAGHNHTVGLKEDGTVVAVGASYYGQLNVSGWTNIKAVAAGEALTVGLKKDGTVVAV
ncbi:MAG: hypothetical protein HY805_09455 [Nitrospirae bacterium]|nr:hypothetical protein [Nitrospirota bacterium]